MRNIDGVRKLRAKLAKVTVGMVPQTLIAETPEIEAAIDLVQEKQYTKARALLLGVREPEGSAGKGPKRA